MKITASQLKQIIFEEYLKEEGIVLDEDKSQELLDYIKGTGPKPDWYDREEKTRTPSPPRLPASDTDDRKTQPFPSYDEPESEYSGFQDRSGPSDIPGDEDLIDSISQMIKGKDPEQVAALFQAVFTQIPGVEIEDPEENPESLYTPGAEGRPPIRRFGDKELNELKKLIREALDDYHDYEMYDVLDQQEPGKKSDAEIVNALWAAGMEKMIVLDTDGTLSNREEVTAALEDDPSKAPDPKAPSDMSSMSWKEKAALMADR